ncbi:glycerophosphodiester phosphodiesterase [Telluria beijingensis]|uniref:glycerophosphodiester phosphodiesterase n=1 Tax=Telluria beijingensis TaxID=3068633 RepID=UPI0027952439|nr:glycerophosphodiester phosphodiesterase [Massilia sp. REN29]
MWPYPRVLAHRGGGTLAPENTFAALRCGMDHGYRAIEFDVMLARDGVPVVIHDQNLKRRLGGVGLVTDYDAAELVQMDVGSWFKPQFAGEPIPDGAEFVRACKAAGVWMNIEIKPARGHDRATGTAVARLAADIFADEIAAGEMARVPLLSSFREDSLDAARAAAPDVPRGLLFERGALPADWEKRARAVGASAIHTHYESLDAALARAIKAAGFGLFCYTVNDPNDARTLLDWGVDAFCTDRIDLIGPSFA